MLQTLSTVVCAAQVLCLQLRRVAWSTRGEPVKLSGHVAFPEMLDLQPFLAAAAEPLLPPLFSSPPAAALSCNPALSAPKPWDRLCSSRTPKTAEEPASAGRPGSAAESGETSCAGQWSSVAGDSTGEDDKHMHDRTCKYRLISLVVHHGGRSQSGHYFAYRHCNVGTVVSFDTGEKAGDISTESWVGAADQEVWRADVEEVLSSEAALLLYERCYR